MLNANGTHIEVQKIRITLRIEETVMAQMLFIQSICPFVNENHNYQLNLESIIWTIQNCSTVVDISFCFQFIFG